MNSNSNAPIPVGFRFHPTDEELVGYYLHGKVGRAQRDQFIQELDLYKFEPWDLHEVCRIGDDAPENQSDWYFFSHKDKKYPTGNRANRATTAGFWKATGRDKPIHTQRHVIGMRKTLVFYRGRAPHGQKTDWIMHEFRLDEGPGVVPNYESDGWVVCRVFRKTKNFKTKSQDTSCSFEEDQQVGCDTLPAELVSSPSHEKYVDSGGGAMNNILQLHHHYNFACKQEISVDDYNAHVHDPFVENLHHLQELHRSLEGSTNHPLAPCSSSTFRSQQQLSRMNSRDHENYSVAPAFHHGESSLREFDETRPNVTQDGSLCSLNFPATYQGEDFWTLESARASLRRDQTLADMTCHVHLKRGTTDHLSASHHENLVHLWNVK